MDQSPSERRANNLGNTKTPKAYRQASDKDLPNVPALETTGAHQSGYSTPLRPSSQWANSGKGKSPTHPEQ